jgi:SAM-dependent methyltransferase
MNATSDERKPMPANTGVRRDAPAFHRNIEPLLTALASRLPSQPGHVLEVGSGTGQHVVRFAEAFPSLTFWPTDVTHENIASTAAWMSAARSTNIAPPVLLEADQPDWHLGHSGRPPATVNVIFSANVIHITPWSVAAGLFAGAARHLDHTGTLILYGPFKRHGQQTAPSNESFDQWLKTSDERWGVRDLDGEIADIAAANGLEMREAHAMPANNLLVSFTRSAA